MQGGFKYDYIRWWHSSWASPSGLILMGGEGGQPWTTEKIMEDGNAIYSFDLKYDTVYNYEVSWIYYE